MSEVEIIFKKFPSLGESIFCQLDIESLAQCKKVNKNWQNFIARKKNFWIKIIQKYVSDFNHDWKRVVLKTEAQKVKDLSLAVHQFFIDIRAAKKSSKWSPLHISVNYGNFNLSQYIIEKIDEKNPVDEVGYTALHLAADKGYSQIAKLIITNIGKINPKIRTTTNINSNSPRCTFR